MSQDSKLSFETIDSKVVYENRWMRVREDRFLYPDGTQGLYGFVEKADFVVVAPVEDDGSMHLVEQYRYPVRQRFWELPQGAWQSNRQADPLDVAKGELREETGLEAAEMTDLGHFFQGYGFSTQGYRVFLARGLSFHGTRRDPEEQDMITRRFSPAEILRMIDEGNIKDTNTIAALGLLRIKGLIAL